MLLSAISAQSALGRAGLLAQTSSLVPYHILQAGGATANAQRDHQHAHDCPAGRSLSHLPASPGSGACRAACGRAAACSTCLAAL